jgi:hypothetical protein
VWGILQSWLGQTGISQWFSQRFGLQCLACVLVVLDLDLSVVEPHENTSGCLLFPAPTYSVFQRTTLHGFRFITRTCRKLAPLPGVHVWGRRASPLHLRSSSRPLHRGRSRGFRVGGHCAGGQSSIVAMVEHPPHADETARVKPDVARRCETKRDLARQKHPRKTECLGENFRLVCNTDSGGRIDSFLRL